MRPPSQVRRLRHEQRHEQRRAAAKDPYEAARKPAGPAACADCGALFHRGRWTWRAAPAHAPRVVCPACRRIRERMPAGFVRIAGAYAREHRDALLEVARACEAAEKSEHPMQRIIAVEQGAQGMLITTTDPHLARRIGEALHRAHRGELACRYAKGEHMLRVHWSR